MAYKRYSNEGKEFDGSFFQSLSLEDTTGFATANGYSRTYRQQTEDDEDLMDIDYEMIDNQQTLHDYHTAQYTPEPESRNAIPGNAESLTPITEFAKFSSTPLHSTPISEIRDKNNIEEEIPSKDSQGGEHEDEYSEGHSSIMASLLSPTILGARMAVGHQKLLLPAPSTDGHDVKEDIDHEFDTSAYRNDSTSSFSNFGTYRSVPNTVDRYRGTTFRNITSFSSNSDLNTFLAHTKDSQDDTEEYVYNRNSGNYDSFGGHNSLYDNSLNQSYLFRRSMNAINNIDNSSASLFGRNPQDTSTVQIHHHHYYYTGNDENKSQMQVTPSRNTNIEHSQQQLQLGAAESPNLPSPWSSNISPIARVPYLLSSYLQLMVNLVASIYTIYVLYCIISAIRRDIDVKLLVQSSNIRSEIEYCKRSYEENNCGPETRVPALEGLCINLQKCINQEQTLGGGNTSSISAETIGMLINSLVEPLGLKFFLVLFGSIVLLFGCNFTFGYIRAKTYYGWNSEEYEVAKKNTTAGTTAQ
ncbi:Di-sulfide bridge nucleocytoplasmic transport domain-containing protein [Scheffersomyces xylosifermentans]|uniref:Di-sulfide bridge nucleocytoplasmic transport domain-containing protein n=1 Tax=Scheffersomyces xylosifermentans TaxID=1304137 RepID=UPI00315CEFFB